MKKLFLAFALTIALGLIFAFVVSAEETSVHNENTVDYNATVTLDDGTVCNLFDSDGNALIWYISGTENGKNVYASIRSDDSQVKWHTKSWGEVVSVSIVLENGTTIQKGKFVVVNMMDDGVVMNAGEIDSTSPHYGNPITGFKWLFDGCTNLEYAYLRLDTTGIYATAFSSCSKLKYINLEDLTNLKRLGNNSIFNGCTSLFEGQVLDLTKTKLEKIDDGSDIFKGVPLKGIILPETFWRFSASTTFKNCTNLETIYLTSKISQVGDNIFDGCTSLRAIFFVGTESELDTFLGLAEASGNDQIADAIKISHADYKALSDYDKANNLYTVYDYASCIYDNGGHEELIASNECVCSCSYCKAILVNHIETEKLVVKFDYSSYAAAGTKTTSCNNEGCTHQNVVTEAPAIFVALGYSVKEDGSALMGGYSINTEALADYNKYAETPISYGIIMTNSHPDENGVIIENGVLKSKYGIQLKANDTSYARLNYTITGFETKDQSSISFIIALYVNDENGISFIQRDTKTSTADVSVDSESITLNTITHKTVVESTIANATEQMNNETDALEKERLQAIINALNVFVA